MTKTLANVLHKEKSYQLGLNYVPLNIVLFFYYGGKTLLYYFSTLTSLF